MQRRLTRLLNSTCATCCLILMYGCVSPQDEGKQLARGAKDWSLVIRASQVLPTYPLTEDLQVGDIFITQIPIGSEVQTYESKGFLPLDNHVARLQPDGYTDFYPAGVYGVRAGVNPPAHWQFPATQPSPRPASQPADLYGWAGAPRAAFPSYTFKIDRSVGANLSLPVQSVPIAVSILGASSAHGEITIADAYTYGIDEASLRKQVDTWRATSDAVKLLKDFPPVTQRVTPKQGLFASSSAPAEPTCETHYSYVRVVSRVYLAGRVNVSLVNDDQFGADVQVRTPTIATLLTPAATNPATNFQSVIDTLNSNITRATSQPSTQPTTKPAAAAASVQVAAVSGRSVSLVETFPRPLVVGYLAFDFPIIDENGTLGSPVPTLGRLLGEATAFGKDANTDRLRLWLAENRDANTKLLKDWLVQQGQPNLGITNLLYQSIYKDLRSTAVCKFLVK